MQNLNLIVFLLGLRVEDLDLSVFDSVLDSVFDDQLPMTTPQSPNSGYLVPSPSSDVPYSPASDVETSAGSVDEGFDSDNTSVYDLDLLERHLNSPSQPSLSNPSSECGSPRRDEGMYIIIVFCNPHNVSSSFLNAPLSSSIGIAY